MAAGEYFSNFMMSGGFTPVAHTSGFVRFTGTVDAEVPADTQLVRADNFAFVVGNTGTIGASGFADVLVSAVLDGAAGITPLGTTLTGPSGLSGVNATATVVEGFDYDSTFTRSKYDVCLAFRDSTPFSDEYPGRPNYTTLGCQNVRALYGQVPTL